MRLLGSIAYEWRGQRKRAVSSFPAVVITLAPRWVAVGRIAGGTELVPWESVIDLSGWAPVASEDR